MYMRAKKKNGMIVTDTQVGDRHYGKIKRSTGYGATECEACGKPIKKSNKWGVCRDCQYEINHANDRW